MKSAKILILFLILSFIAVTIIFTTYAFQTNSSNYRLSPLIVSSGGEITKSNNYTSYSATGIIAGKINSILYKNFLGFFYTWLLANNQPCSTNEQCEGGYCCSGVCQDNACPSSSSGGGGGRRDGEAGGGVFITTLQEKRDFSINPDSVKIKLALGDFDEKKLMIKNTGNVKITIPLQVEGIKKYMSLSDNFASLEPDETKEVTLSFTAIDVGSHVGEIIAKAGEIEKSIALIFEVISKLVLFDVKLDIPAQYEDVEPGQELKAQITLLNVGAPEKVDVFATYFIKDLRGDVIYEETETFSVERQLSYEKLFRIHKSVPPGSYVVVAEIRYANSFAVSSQLFRVVEKKEETIIRTITRNTSIMLFLVFMIVFIISVLAYNLVLIKRKEKKKERYLNRK